MLRSYHDPLVTDSNEENTSYTYICSTVTPEAKLAEITSMSPKAKKSTALLVAAFPQRKFSKNNSKSSPKSCQTSTSVSISKLSVNHVTVFSMSVSS